MNPKLLIKNKKLYDGVPCRVLLLLGRDIINITIFIVRYVLNF